MAAKNAFYAQSGGVTAVINATACGLIQEARRHPERIGKVLAGRDGIIGALTEDLIDTSLESDADIARLRNTPGGAATRVDEARIRALTVQLGIPCLTTMAAAQAALGALERLGRGPLTVLSLQEIAPAQKKAVPCKV